MRRHGLCHFAWCQLISLNLKSCKADQQTYFVAPWFHSLPEEKRRVGRMAFGHFASVCLSFLIFRVGLMMPSQQGQLSWGRRVSVRPSLPLVRFTCIKYRLMLVGPFEECTRHIIMSYLVRRIVFAMEWLQEAGFMGVKERQSLVTGAL